MLESIQINNFAIIDSLNLEFEAGLTALTGETGAGKSILLDAIKLIAGDRADSDSVKAGKERAEISVCFDIRNHQRSQHWLGENEMSSDGECIIRRVVYATGRSKAFINGFNAPLSQLKELSQMLVDIHGQHEHQSLQKPQVQQQLLDEYLNEKALLTTLKQQYANWHQLKAELQQLQGSVIERDQRIDLLRLYCQELNQLNLASGEMDQLQAEYQRLSHAGQLLETTSTLLAMLYDNDEASVQSALSHCDQSLATLLSFDSSLSVSHELISSALIQVQEASTELRNYQQSINIDEARLDDLNQRISSAQDLARKHHVTVDDLPELTRTLQQELDDLLGSEQNQDEIRRQLEKNRDDYLQSARQLSTKRQKTAKLLSAQITDVMQQLGMVGGSFSILVETVDAESAFRSSGIDNISYLVSANPGQPLKPLHKVASGGELSRISLAIQVILSESSAIPSLIFDEVDSGVGGGIAEIVGKKLRLLGENRQVFCVTHLPQVASQAHHHFRVEKSSSKDNTTTDVVALEADARLEEIARMLGGITITDQTRAHASEMITSQR